MRHELESLIDQYSEKLLRYATSILYNHQDAEDVVQDVFMAAHQKSAETTDNISAWLYKVTYNKSINKLNRRKFLFFGDIPENTVASSARTGLSEEMHYALSLLKPHDRALIYSRIVEGYNYDELSLQMGTSAAALRKRYERAKKKLSDYFENSDKREQFAKTEGSRT